MKNDAFDIEGNMKVAGKIKRIDPNKEEKSKDKKCWFIGQY